MAETKYLILYVLFIIFFNSFLGMFLLSDQNVNIQDYLYISNIRQNLQDNESWFTDIINVLLVPFMIFDAIIGIIVLMGVSFTVMPPFLNLLIYTPLSLFVFIDYVVPMIRGN
jgi:hypothetical protein